MTKEQLGHINSIKDLLEDHPERKEMLSALEDVIAESKFRKSIAIKSANILKESDEVIAQVKRDMMELKIRNDSLYKKNKELLEEKEVKNVKD